MSSSFLRPITNGTHRLRYWGLDPAGAGQTETPAPADEAGETTQPEGEKGGAKENKSDADGDSGCSFVPHAQKGGALSVLKLVLGDLF